MKKKNDEEIVIPVATAQIILLNVLCALLVVVESRFFELPLTDIDVLPAFGLWFVIFCICMKRKAISPKGIRILLWRIPLRYIKSERIQRIEVIRWYEVMHIIFELDKCPQFHDGAMISLPEYLMLHPFSAIDYGVLKHQEEMALNMVRSMFDAEIVDFTKE